MYKEAQGGGNYNTQERRTSTPQTVQNYQTFHQQQQQQHQQLNMQQQISVNDQTEPQPNTLTALQNPYVVPQHPKQPHSQEPLCSNKDGKRAKYAKADSPQ